MGVHYSLAEHHHTPTSPQVHTQVQLVSLLYPRSLQFSGQEFTQQRDIFEVFCFLIGIPENELEIWDFDANQSEKQQQRQKIQTTYPFKAILYILLCVFLVILRRFHGKKVQQNPKSYFPSTKQIFVNVNSLLLFSFHFLLNCQNITNLSRERIVVKLLASQLCYPACSAAAHWTKDWLLVWCAGQRYGRYFVLGYDNNTMWLLY